MKTDHEIYTMAEAYWQDDLSKFTPTWRESPAAYRLMYLAGFRACEELYEARITRLEKKVKRSEHGKPKRISKI